MKKFIALLTLVSLGGCFQESTIQKQSRLLAEIQESFGRGNFEKACSKYYDYMKLLESDKNISAKELKEARMLHANICTFKK